MSTNNETILDPNEIDTVIESYYQTKQEIKKLEEKHDEFRQILYDLLNSSNTDIIKGKNLQVRKIVQNRSFVNKDKIPENILEQCMSKKKITILTVHPNIRKSRSRSPRKK
jgi:hypothetical protein